LVSFYTVFPPIVRYPELIIPFAPLSSNFCPPSFRLTSRPPEILIIDSGKRNLSVLKTL